MTEERRRQSRYDAIVIGARCAGAATAMLLSRRGLKVLVVDRSRHGSDTLSTHALMRGAVVQLHRWGLLHKIRSAGTPKISTTSFHYGTDCVEVPIKPQNGIEGLYAPRRTVIDPILADAAAEAGAEILRGPRLVDLVRTKGGRVRGVVIEHSPGKTESIPAGIVIGADGTRSTVARLVHTESYDERREATGVVYGYWKGLELNGYHWHFSPGVGAGVIPTNDGACVFAGVPQKRFWEETRFDLERSYFQVLQENSPELAERIRAARQVGGFRGYAGQPGYLRKSWGPGWALVGDAGYFKDPITAHGITDALRDAELLARAVEKGTSVDLADYQRVRDELSLGLFRITSDIAAFDWDLPQLQRLHKEMSEEMKQEVKHLSGLGEDFVSASSPLYRAS